MPAHIRKRLALVTFAIVLSLVIGTGGFVVIEGYPLVDAFYMSLITVATVGYTEVHPLSTAGRIFNSALILFGVTTLFLGVAAMAQTVIELELSGYFPKRRIKKMIENLKDHYIVCGFGRVGRGAAAELKRSGVPFIIVDRSEAKVDRAMRDGLLAGLGDSTLDATLREVGIERARGLIAALATDADNLFLTISAKTLNPMLNVAARVVEEEAEEKFRRAGADAVFATYTITGSRLAQSILRPHVVHFLDLATMDTGLKVSIEQVRVGESSEFVSKSLRQIQLRREVGVIVLAIRRAGGEMLFNPDPEAEIRAGDHLIAMGTEEQLAKMNQLMAEAHA
jgi:voltage-gated potassium channel